MAQVGKFHDDEHHVTLHYELFNSGSTKVLMIMGLLTDCEAWMPLVNELVHDDRLQLCIYDNRGLPRSPAPSGRYTTSMMAKDASRLAKHLGWDKYHVVGTSMGGMIAQELALLEGDDVIQSLTLLCTHGGLPRVSKALLPDLLEASWLTRTNTHSDSGKTARAPLAGSKIFIKSFTTSDPKERLTLITDLLYGTKLRANAEKFEKVKEFHWQRIQSAVNTHHLNEHKFERLRGAKYPKVVITGDEDILVCPKNSDLLAERIQCEKIILEGAGHGLVPHHEDLIPVLDRLWYNDSQ